MLSTGCVRLQPWYGMVYSKDFICGLENEVETRYSLQICISHNFTKQHNVLELQSGLLHESSKHNNSVLIHRL